MQFPGTLASCITGQELLAPHTWFGLGGPARWLARPASLEHLLELTRTCRDRGIDTYRLGLGANLLVSDDGVDGMVIRLNTRAFTAVEWPPEEGPDGDEVRVVAGGGADMNRLAREAVRRGLAGLEVLAGIPGSLGGIIRMNAGGRFGQIADIVRDVTVVDEDCQLRTLTPDQVGFGYRHTDLGNAIVCRATLGLRRTDPVALRKQFLELWNYKKNSQPMGDSSAGCVFKNPPGRSAGELIDRCGLKGRTVGGAYVSAQHANFICAKDGASAGDVLALIGQVRREVAQRTGVELELELEVWGHQWARPVGAAC